MKNIIIISAGKFGREVYTWVVQSIGKYNDWRIKGFLDDRKGILHGFSYDIPILGSVEEYKPDSNDLFLCAIGSIEHKKKYCDILCQKGGKFATFIHPSSIIGKNVNIGEGSIIGPLTQMTCEIKIGKHVVVDPMTNIGHDVNIGDYTQICGNCAINGNVKIGTGVFVGSGATLIPQILIGDDVFIGAGSVVIRNVKEGSRVFGNPAIEI
jgi:sugar O-acyltransferase (sialic acid O-acetyltransferase NeuD family)